MGYAVNLEQQVATRFVNDIEQHVITELHRAGLHGYWHCAKPTDSNMWFDIVTFPGGLLITGDMGDYLFRRHDDMIPFMRGSAMSFGYVAEKCVAHDGRLREWQPELFREALDAFYAENKNDHEDPETFKERLDDLRRWADDGEQAAMQAAHESGLFDAHDPLDCRTFGYHFLWCLHAIKWFCDRVEDLPTGPSAVSC